MRVNGAGAWGVPLKAGSRALIDVRMRTSDLAVQLVVARVVFSQP